MIWTHAQYYLDNFLSFINIINPFLNFFPIKITA